MKHDDTHTPCPAPSYEETVQARPAGRQVVLERLDSAFEEDGKTVIDPNHATCSGGNVESGYGHQV